MTLATTSLAHRASRSASYAGVLLAAIAVLLLALAPIGYRAGWWPYRFSLLSLMLYSAYFGLAAAAVSTLALLVGRSARGASRPRSPPSLPAE